MRKRFRADGARAHSLSPIDLRRRAERSSPVDAIAMFFSFAPCFTVIFIIMQIRLILAKVEKKDHYCWCGFASTQSRVLSSSRPIYHLRSRRITTTMEWNYAAPLISQPPTTARNPLHTHPHTHTQTPHCAWAYSEWRLQAFPLQQIADWWRILNDNELKYVPSNLLFLIMFSLFV